LVNEHAAGRAEHLDKVAHIDQLFRCGAFVARQSPNVEASAATQIEIARQRDAAGRQPHGMPAQKFA
jgi:hypothetical protein